MASKNPRKRPPDKRDPVVQRLLFYALPEAAKRRHKHQARHDQYEHQHDLTYELTIRYGYRCLCCGTTRHLGLDHIVPVSRGGKTELDNLQLLCRDCNHRKGTEIIDYRGRK